MVGIAGAKRESRPYSRHILEADRGKIADVHWICVHLQHILPSTSSINHGPDVESAMSNGKPWRLITVNTSPERAKRLIGRVAEALRGKYDVEHVDNVTSRIPLGFESLGRH
jgi:hypothetical protein